MNDFLIPVDLGDLVETDGLDREDIIKIRKDISFIIKECRARTKKEKCYYCKKVFTSFCNSHTVPRFCLESISKNGDVSYINTILENQVFDIHKGLNNAGTFKLICNGCDNDVFKEYESPENYDEIPTIKMLAQIDMKNNLKNISKRLIELEMIELHSEKINNNYLSRILYLRKHVKEMDIKEYKYAFYEAKKSDKRPKSGDYYIGYYKELEYIVPVAFQGTRALIQDLDGNDINEIYNYNPEYKIKSVSLCIFPLKDKSIIMLFVDKKNRRYSRFFRQLKNVCLEDQLSIINYILFAYGEDYFLSPNLSKEVLDNLKKTSGKTTEFISLFPNEKRQIEEVKKVYDYDDRLNTPNLLLERYAVHNIK